MSERSRYLPRRSCISVPGSSARFIGKVSSIPADMSFFDLEDSVTSTKKGEARTRIVRAISDTDWDERVLCVRVNSWDSAWTYQDVAEVVGNCGPRLDEVMLPKVESRDHVKALDLLLNQVERNAGLSSGSIGIEVQIESALGLMHVEEICSASQRLEAVVFGPLDFAASMQMPMFDKGDVCAFGYPGDPFQFAFAKILIAGRANGLQVIDGPYPKIKDIDGLRDDCKRTVSLGFDGKWCIHPDQVQIVNEMYTPSQEQFDRAWAVVDACDKASEFQAKGAVVLNDEMIDQASRKLAMTLISRGQRAGMDRGSNRL